MHNCSGPSFAGRRAGCLGRNTSTDRWTATENVAWKRDIPGRGWSSPVVWNDSVFLTTVVNTGTTEEAKKGLYFGGERPTPDSIHRGKSLPGSQQRRNPLGNDKFMKANHSRRSIKKYFASERPLLTRARLLLLRQRWHLLFRSERQPASGNMTSNRCLRATCWETPPHRFFTKVNFITATTINKTPLLTGTRCEVRQGALANATRRELAIGRLPLSGKMS